MAFKRILLPIDGSPAVNQAANEAVSIAASFGASVLVLEVTDTAEQIVAQLGTSRVVMERVLPTRLETEQRRAQGDVHEIALRLRKDLIVVDELIAHGPAGPTILSVARDEGCDLVVMCTHGRSGPERGKLGTVTDYVVRHSPIPVLVTHAS